MQKLTKLLLVIDLTFNKKVTLIKIWSIAVSSYTPFFRFINTKTINQNMKFNIKINQVTTLEELPNYWSNNDFVNLLDAFSFPEGNTIKPENLREMLFMAISDFEPNEAAAIVLGYKLSERLNEGQIEQVSNDMLIDKVCEEFPEIDLHATLFAVNQLLFQAYNGKFPNAKATQVDFSMSPLDEDSKVKITKEYVLKAFKNGISDSNVIKRLFEEQLNSTDELTDADAILWELNSSDNENFKLITSEYWLDREELIASEFDGEFEVADKE